MKKYLSWMRFLWLGIGILGMGYLLVARLKIAGSFNEGRSQLPPEHTEPLPKQTPESLNEQPPLLPSERSNALHEQNPDALNEPPPLLSSEQLDTQTVDSLTEGTGLFNSNNMSISLQGLETIRQMFKMQGFRDAEAFCLILIGGLKEGLGDPEGALSDYEESLLIAQEIGDSGLQKVALSKIGGFYFNKGQYSLALEKHQQALEISPTADDTFVDAAIISNVGVVYQAQGQFRKAEDNYNQALKISQSINLGILEAATLNNIATLYVFQHRHIEALKALDDAQTIIQDVDKSGRDFINQLLNWENSPEGNEFLAELGDNPVEKILIQTFWVVLKSITFSNLAATHSELGNYEKSEELLEDALDIANKLGLRPLKQTILSNLGSVYYTLGKDSQGLKSLEKALKMARSSDDLPGQALILNQISILPIFFKEIIADVPVSQEEYRAALPLLEEAFAISQKIGNRRLEGMSLHNLGFIYNSLGQGDKELETYQQTLDVANQVGSAWMKGITLANLGFTYESQGDKVRALDYYKQAIAIKEKSLGDIKIEELKTTFIDGQINLYEQTIALLWEEGKFAESFNYVERARARVFLDQINSGRVNIRAGNVSNLLERERELKNQIRARSEQLINLRSLPTTEQDKGVIKEVETLKKDLEKEYTDLLTQLKIQNPEVADLVSIDQEFFSNSMKTIQGLLDPETTLLEYFVTKEQTFAFIVTRNIFETVPIEIDRDELTKTITAFRNFASLDNPHPKTLQELHKWLIEPVEKYLKTPTISIVPHGVLHYLPFAALTDGNQYLSDKFTLSNLPSGNVLRFLPGKRKPSTNTVLVLGNPDTREPLAPLVFATKEAETIANSFGTNAKVEVEATETLVKSESRQAGILHLAAHGQYNIENPLFSSIYLTEDEQNDGRLEVHEVYELDLKKATNLVVLSACQTKKGDLSEGDEIVGLNRAFLLAGTPSVVASLWTVNDEATALLMEQFYTYLHQGMGKAEALQQAQINLRAKYPHPYYWSAFVLTGDGGAIK